MTCRPRNLTFRRAEVDVTMQPVSSLVPASIRERARFRASSWWFVRTSVNQSWLFVGENEGHRPNPKGSFELALF